MALFAVAPASGDRPPEPARRYEVSVDEALEILRARLCFADRAPARLAPGVPEAAVALMDATDDAGRPIATRRGIVETAGLPPGSCVRYRVDLGAAMRSTRFAVSAGGEHVSTQGVWLWRDAGAAPPRASLRFSLPRGVVVSTPWPSGPDRTLRLTQTAFTRPGFVAFGRRAPRAVERAGVCARLLPLGDGWALDDDALAAWLAETIDGVASVRGRFPVSDLLVILVPAHGDQVAFGMVRRGGGYAALYLVGRDATRETLRRSWVTWHELSHLLLPALRSRDAWLYEGLATYYQEVLPARRGVQPPERAWATLAEGFRRGARSADTTPLGDASAAMMQTRGFERVYWAGTAFALEADVALRGRGSSLDHALRRAAPRWRGDATIWDAERLLAALDGAAPPLLAPLGARWTAQRSFPDTDRLLRRLGVRPGDGVLEDGELARVRDAIMAP
ncbi:MAG: hypothetical protein KF729_31025 [Sandaracinaceae bacterium]|nr:hypothetical protein [Sandaracinaceae bacterium]